jgi:hypothetical protein
MKETVCSFDQLYRAMLLCRRDVMWKDSVARYVHNGLVNVYRLKQSLDNDTYKLGKYTRFQVYEPKERDIISAKFRDRVFQKSFCTNYFYPVMTRSFIYDNCACQIGKGNEFGRKRLIRHLQKYIREHGNADGWVFQYDIKNFFGSTSHEVAMTTVKKRITDPWAIHEVQRVVDSFNFGPNPDVGMGLGSDMTQIIELAVLDELDHIIKERFGIKYNIRYNDDVILIHESKEYLVECWHFIDSWMKEHGFTLNPKKTRIYPIRQGIHFLGFRFLPKDNGRVIMTVLKSNVTHERKKLKKLVNLAKSGRMTKSDVDRCYESWKSYVSNHHKRGTKRKKAHRDTHNLILQMDKYYKELWR